MKLIVEGKRFVVLFSEVKKAPSEDRIKQAYNLGSMLARMHRASDQQAFTVSRTPIAFKQLVENPLEKVRPYLIKRQKDYDFLYHAADKLWQYIEKELNYEKPFYGYCHGDIHSGNVFFEGDIPRIFDFDCMGDGWRAYDICVFAWNETFSDEKFIESEVWTSYLKGYNAVHQLEENETRAINAFGALQQLWMIGIHADVMKRNAGCCWHDDGYFDYQIGIFKLWYDRTFL